MNVKQYCKNRRLEMVKENQSLEQKRKQLVSQGQVMQAQLNQINRGLTELEIELELLDKLEASLNGKKEVEKC